MSTLTRYAKAVVATIGTAAAVALAALTAAGVAATPNARTVAEARADFNRALRAQGDVAAPVNES